MAKTISIGAQGFEALRVGDYFYIDKTGFVRDWWLSGDVATLICRPRRFGKTLNLDTVRCFLSTEYAGRGEELFGGLSVWDDPAMRALQGTVPVVSLSFARVKESDPRLSIAVLKRVLADACHEHDYLLDSTALSAADKGRLTSVADDMDDGIAADCLGQLCRMLAIHHGTAPVVLLDEYDTPMQEAWVGGWWDEMAGFVRSLFNATFKTNPALGRALITGVTRISRESIFSDLNNLKVVGTLTNKYETDFGFTEDEVFAALDAFGLGDERDAVREWYDGFSFGGVAHIYNPWSVTNYLDDHRLLPYWSNTSSNSLVSLLVRTGDASLTSDFEALLAGRPLRRLVDDEVAFSDLTGDARALWGLLLSTGYLRAEGIEYVDGRACCDLTLTNHEVLVAFEDMVSRWFGPAESAYNEFCRALLAGDAEAMSDYLSDVVQSCASSFDVGTRASERSQPERFYHGLVLGLLVELRGRYSVESNRESGFGRYDVALVPNDVIGGNDPAIIIEFKVFDAHREATLADTAMRALEQVDERGYATALVGRGIDPKRILSYGIAFRGKEVLAARRSEL